MSKHEEPIINTLKTKGPLTANGVAAELGVKLGTARRTLRRMKDEGKLTAEPSTLKGRGEYHHYKIAAGA